MVSSDAIALSAAAKTAGTTDPVAIEPPESGPSGSDVSPSATSILSSGTPVFCEASCARIVYVPVPMSCVAQATRAVPSSRSCDARLGGESCGDPRASGHSPAERQAVALHRADLGRALRPAELLRAEFKALEQMTRRERNAQPLVDLRLVENAELDRIDLELIGQFVHRRLGRVEPGHGAGAAHVRRCADVALGASERHAQVGHAVLERRRLAAVFVMGIEH